ncbi:DUF3168 domain-containing protein [Bradyrhizobium diazoefficiens]
MAFTDPAADLWAAIEAKLRSDQALSALIDGRIFDRVPAKPDYPLVTIGNMQVIPESADGVDAGRNGRHHPCLGPVQAGRQVAPGRRRRHQSAA